jgi:hypothetical protein
MSRPGAATGRFVDVGAYMAGTGIQAPSRAPALIRGPRWFGFRNRSARTLDSSPVPLDPHSVLSGGAVKAFQRWIDRMPAVYRESFGEPEGDKPEAEGLDIAADDFCLAQLKDYRSLMPMAQEAKKPMFLLKPADGAIGGHQGAVRKAYKDFRGLAEAIIERVGGL